MQSPLHRSFISDNSRVGIGTEPQVNTLQRSTSSVGALKVTDCADHVVEKIDDLLAVIDKGTTLSRDSDEQGWAESCLQFARNAFVIPNATRSSVQPVAEGLKIRGYYQREVCQSFLGMYEQGEQTGASLTAIAEFLKDYSEVLSLSARYQYESAERLLAPALSSFADSLYAIGARAHHAEFRVLLENDIEHIRSLSPAKSKELWHVQCFDSPDVFYRKFPTLSSQRTAIDILREKSAEAAWTAALKDAD